jgi:hypothetical protein
MSLEKLQALSVRPPFAEEILNGEKTIEYRLMPTNKRERVYIYESKAGSEGRGLILGTVEIVNCRLNEDEEYEWDLANPVRLDFPIAPTGKPQPVFFNPFPSSLDQFSEQDKELKEALATDRMLSRFKDDLRVARARAVAAERRAANAERFREALFDLKEQSQIQLPSWLTQSADPDDRAARTPILVTSDFQWGERISSENMDGLNEYNVEIAEARYKTLITKTVDISFNQLQPSNYSGMIYLRLGDTISGEIHADLRESNVLQAVPAVKSVVEAEAWGLRFLADSFGKVHVISVSGNHGRTTPKPQAKRGGADNFDTISAWWLESIFKSDPRFSFQTPESPDAIFTLHGKRYLATHGDKIGSRGGEGFIGPAATIMRGMKRTVDTYAKMGMPIAKIFMGHFHTAYDLGYGWCNGSLPGYSEYARDGRMTPEPPIQWLLIFHPQYGCVSQWPIMVDGAPTATKNMEVMFT